MFDTSKFLFNNKPAPADQHRDPEPFSFEAISGDEAYPDCIVTFNHKDFKLVERAHLLEQGLYLGLRATVTDQNLYLLDISLNRYEKMVKYCRKKDYSTIVESSFDSSGMLYHNKEWAGKWGWVIQDFLKQVADWNKC